MPLDLGSTRRATEHSVPWFLLDDGGSEQFFGGLLWPGAWSAHFERQSTSTHATFGLTSFSTSVGATPLDTPHGYVGLTDNTAKSVGEATRVFINSAVRHGRSYSPLVTYNTWFAYGTDINEASMIHEMDAAADLGVELFVVDAGWYEAGSDPSDFTTGIGVWEADPDRFPSGLSALSDHAHTLGMKFGIWVEPERVDLKTVGKAGLARERWLATQSRPVQSREDQRHREFRSALPGEHRGARVDSWSPLGAHRCRTPRLPEMGQQFLGQLHALGTRSQLR